MVMSEFSVKSHVANFVFFRPPSMDRRYAPVAKHALALLLVFALLHCAVAVSRDDIIDTNFKLEVLTYEDTPAFLERLRVTGEPVLLKGTPAQTKWNAMKSWVPHGKSPSRFYLSEQSSARLGVKRHNSPKFPIGCCELKPMTQKEFWIEMVGLPDDEFMYLNAEIGLLDPSIRADAAPQFFSSQSTRLGKVITNVWMGSKGSTAAVHHDPFDNFFVQIYGSKRFTLFPPEVQHALYVYPKTHPASRQAQVNINKLYGEDGVSTDSPIVSTELAKFPLLAEPIMLGAGIEIVVNPGDVLYLPPFWFHQVESLDTAISINTWFNSPYVEKMDKAWDEALPFAADWSDEGFALGAKELISQVIQQVLGDPKDSAADKKALMRDFVQSLVNSRFKPLYGPTSTAKSDILKGIKTLNDPHLRVHLKEQEQLDQNSYISEEGVLDLESICSMDSQQIFKDDPTLGPQFTKAVAAISRHFQVSDAALGLQMIHLNDFVEDIIGQVVGDKSVYHFLVHCLLSEPEDFSS